VTGLASPSDRSAAPVAAERLAAVFKAYDIRGLAPEQLDADLCGAVGAAFAAFVSEADGAERVLVARDMRPTGPALVDAFADGVTSQGLDVVDVGLGSTDMLYFAAGALDAPGAMFTASHNPAAYNGIKLCRPGARPVRVSGQAWAHARNAPSARGARMIAIPRRLDACSIV